MFQFTTWKNDSASLNYCKSPRYVAQLWVWPAPVWNPPGMVFWGISSQAWMKSTRWLWMRR